VADFGSWGPLELKITLGELTEAVATAAAAWWVAHVIQRKQASAQATKDLLIGLCRDELEDLNALSNGIEGSCPRAGHGVVDGEKEKLLRLQQRLSNSIHTIELAVDQAGLTGLVGAISSIKTLRENLHSQVIDPLVVAGTFDSSQLRQIEGTLRATREATIKLQLEVNRL